MNNGGANSVVHGGRLLGGSGEGDRGWGRRQSRRIGHSRREQLVGTLSSREYAQNIFRRILVPRGEVMVSSFMCIDQLNIT